MQKRPSYVPLIQKLVRACPLALPHKGSVFWYGRVGAGSSLMFSLQKGTFLCMNAKVSACFFAYVLKLDMPGSSLRPSECVNKNQKFKHDSSSALISEIIIQFEHRTSSERRWTCTDETSCKTALRCESLNVFQCLPCSVHVQVAGFYADSGSAPPLLEEPPVSTFHYLSWKIDAFVLFGWPHSSVQATSKLMLLSETCIFHCKRILTSPQLSPIKSHTHRIRLCFAHHSYKAAICCRPNSLTHCQTTVIARQASHLDVAPKRSSSLRSHYHSLKRGPDGCLMSLDQFAMWSGILYSFLFSSLLHGWAGSLFPPNLAFLMLSGLSVALTTEYLFISPFELQRLTKEKKQKKKKDKRKGKKGNKGKQGGKKEEKRMVLLELLVLVLILLAVGGTEEFVSWFACQWIYPKVTQKWETSTFKSFGTFLKLRHVVVGSCWLSASALTISTMATGQVCCLSNVTF